MRLFPRKTPPVEHLEPSNKVQLRKWDLVWRALVFIILELAFLALATLCLIKPIPLLPSSTTLVTAKAITTAIAVAWHTIAIFPIKDIISTVLSAECMAQYRRTGRLQPNVTDRISCITAGLLAQISHFLTLRPTLEYRLAFLLVLLTMALAPLGPSVISLSPSLIPHHEDLPIANLTMSKALLSTSQYRCAIKADEIINFELVEGGMYGYETPVEEILIPWPNLGLEGNQKLIQYESDVVVYNYTCQWSKFMFNNSEVVITDVANTSWALWNGHAVNVGGILFHLGDEYENDSILPLSNLEDDPLPVSAFIFAGSGDPRTYDPLGTVVTWVPATDGLKAAGSNAMMIFDRGTMAATLLCDPHYTIRTANVILQDGRVSAALVERPLVGNFPESAANSLFSQAFLNALVPDVGISSSGVLPFTMGRDGNQTLLTLPQINDNMNRIIRSAAKAYISGYTGSNESPLGIFPSYTSFNQTATVQYPEISLVSSQSFLVALWVLVGVIIMILAILLCIINARDVLLFNLQTMETIYMNLPTGDNADDLPLPQHHAPGSRAAKLEFAWRVVVFVILEGSFLAFAGYCSTNPIPVDLPSFISPSQAKSATTAIVVAWRTLAVFPMKDIISLVFSAECIAQYNRTGVLEPNVTDRVSHPTTGLLDQISHYLGGWPTLGYRLAFSLVFFVSLIGPLGPGVVTLSELPATFPKSLLVANLSSLSTAFTNPERADGQSQRAQQFIDFELLEGRVYGYDAVAEGVLIPWPESGFEPSENVTMYESDVAVYNFTCHWTTVGDNQFTAIPSAPPNVKTWSIWSNGFAIPFIGETEGIFPLMTSIPGTASQSPLIIVVFTGNSTLLDLGSTGTSIHFTPRGHPEIAMSLSVLVCEPQYKIQRGNITLSSGNLTADILPALPLLGNFPEDSANTLFSEALIDTFEEQDTDRPLSPISMLLFTEELNGAGPLQPLPLPVINNNMNRALKSAAKAYLTGYDFSGNPEPMLSNYKPWNQTAIVQYQQITLVTSRPFFTGLLVLVAMTVIILAIMLKAVDIGKVQLFNLQTLNKIYADEILARDN